MATKQVIAALSLAGAVSLGAMPLQAAPLTSLSAAVKPAAQASDTVQVRWGGWHGGWHGGWRGGGFGFGIGALAAGALIGAAIASPYYAATPYYDVGYPYYGYPDSYSYAYPSYGWGVSTAYYPAYSYSYYRPFRHFAYRRHVYVGHRPIVSRSFAMYSVHHDRHHGYRHHWR